MKACRKILFTFSVAGACLLWSCQEEDIVGSNRTDWQFRDYQQASDASDVLIPTDGVTGNELQDSPNSMQEQNNVYRDRSGYGLR